MKRLTSKADLTMRYIGRRGGRKTFERYGIEHYCEMSRRALSTKSFLHEGLLSLQQASETYSIPPSTMHLWSVAPLTRYTFEGDRRVYVSAEELERLLAKSMAKTVAKAPEVSPKDTNEERLSAKYNAMAMRIEQHLWARLPSNLVSSIGCLKWEDAEAPMAAPTVYFVFGTRLQDNRPVVASADSNDFKNERKMLDFLCSEMIRALSWR